MLQSRARIRHARGPRQQLLHVGHQLALHLRDGRRAAWLTGCIFSLPATAFVLSAQRWTRYGDRASDRAICRLPAPRSAASTCRSCGIWPFAILFFALGMCVASIAPRQGDHLPARAGALPWPRLWRQQSAVMLGPDRSRHGHPDRRVPGHPSPAINALLYLTALRVPHPHPAVTGAAPRHEH